jgi:hypothetical protein
MMTRKLSDADRAAVDLLLDRTQAAKAAGGAGGNGNSGNGGDGMVMMSNAVSDERLSAAQKVLSALDAMAAPEPPVDLTVRTLQRIARAANEPKLMQQQPQSGQSMIDPSAPLA